MQAPVGKDLLPYIGIVDVGERRKVNIIGTKVGPYQKRIRMQNPVVGEPEPRVTLLPRIHGKRT